MDLNYVVKDEINIRQVLKEHFGISNRLLLKLKQNKKIYLNGSNNIYLDFPVNENDLIEVDLNFEEDNSNIVPVKMDLKILYEDDSLIIIDKPPHMPVHPSLNHYENSLSNGLKYYYDSINLHRLIRPINRLDKDTSGIVMFAKNEYIQSRLKDYTKEYIAIVVGKLEGKGIIDEPIKRKADSIIERCVSNDGEKAVTEYEVIKNFNVGGEDLTEVKCILHTGRTHQIRVHMAYIGHPILGDTLYGNPSNLIDRQALHAYRIKFVHPITKKEIEIVSKPISRVLFKVIIYLGYVSLHTSCHQIKEMTSSLSLLVSVLLQMGFTRLDVSPHLR